MFLEFFRFFLGQFVIDCQRIIWCHYKSDYTLTITIITPAWDVIGLSHWWHRNEFLCVLLFWTFLIIPQLAPGYFGVVFSSPKEPHPAPALEHPGPGRVQGGEQYAVQGTSAQAGQVSVQWLSIGPCLRTKLTAIAFTSTNAFSCVPWSPKPVI